jgi:hypothetical protein
MATLALRRPAAVSARTSLLVPLVLGIAGVVLGWVGSGWDVSWHRIIGRDTFWTPPHDLMYAGTALSGIAALVATGTAMAGRAPRLRELALGPLHVERPLALVGIGSLVIVSAAPFDEYWHRTFGKDVDIWSPPHLAAVAGGLIVYVGWATAAGANVFGFAPRLRDALTAFFVAGVIAIGVFGMNFYYIMGWSREALFYPLVVCVAAPFALALAASLIPGRFAATAVALTYTGLALVTFQALRSFGWPPAAFPPLVVAGAVAIDLLRGRTRNALVLGAAFALAFVAFEGARLLLFPPPPLSAASLGDPTSRGILLTYWYAAQARPWLSAWPLLAAIAGAPLAAASWIAGTRAAGVLTAR